LLTGIVQGLTEFLPVSSSGHIVLLQALAGINNEDLIFEVVLHFATLLALLTFFRKDFIEILGSLFQKKVFRKGGIPTAYNSDENFRLALGIIIGTIPAGIIGFLLEDTVTKTFNQPVLASVFLIVTGIVLYLTKIVKERKTQQGIRESFIIGIFQAAAIFPGISRSGMTISGGLFLGLSRENAVKFAFFLSAPVILGVTVKELLNFFSRSIDAGMIVSMIPGFIAAYVSGYLAIKFLIKLAISGKFYLFSGYCIIVGLISFGYFAL